MSLENITFGTSLLGTGLLLVAVCFPLTKDRIKPNRFYGVRLPKSYQSTENWYKMNRYGGKQLMNCGLAMALCGALAFFLPIQGNEALIQCFAWLPLLLLIMPVIQIFRYSKTI